MKAYISTIILCLVSVFTMNAYAEPAIVFEGDVCYVEFDPDPDLDPEVEPGSSYLGLLGDKVHATVAVSGNNETPFTPAKVTCQGLHDFPIERAAVVRLPCIVFNTPNFGTIVTENGIVALTPSGGWTAQCMFSKDTGRQN
jgi:hypothetical protein